MVAALAPHDRSTWARSIVALAVVAIALVVVDPGQSQSGDDIVNSLGMKFVLVPRGNFRMGSPDEEEFRGDDEFQHQIQIARSFYLGACEVTQKHFEQVMKANPSFFCATGEGRIKVTPKQSPMYPVEGVTWHQAHEFCAKLSAREDEVARKFTYRLPTEAEWEYACRAGTTAPLFFGDHVSSHDANFNGVAPLGKGRMGPFVRATWTIGGYKANAFGLFDMHGNVAEWCADWHQDDFYRKSPKADPTGPATGDEKVVRGGGWTNTARACRSAARFHLPPDHSSYNVGFRVVLIVNE